MGESAPGSRAGSATSASSSRRSVVQVMQKDALERLDLRQMLLAARAAPGRRARRPSRREPALAQLGHARRGAGDGPDRRPQGRRRAGAQARRTRCARPLPAASNRATRNRRPRHNEIDWNRTIRANLQALSARVPHDHPRDADRLRPQAAARCARSSSASTRAARWRHRSSTPGSSARSSRACRRCQTQRRRLRHRRRRPDRRAARPGRPPLRHAARRRQRHPGALTYCQGLITRPARRSWS